MRPLPDHDSKVVRLDAHVRNHRQGTNALTDVETLPSDNELFHAVKQGDAQALGALYDRYAAKVYRIAKRLIQDDQTIQEVIQDVFTRIWTTHSFDSNLGVFDHWLAVVARRIAIDHVRKHKKTTSPWPQTELTAGDDTERTTSNRLLRSDLFTAMSELDSDQRTILHFAYFEGYTLAEISSILGIPLGTVKSKLHKSLKKMRATMTDWIEEVRQ